MAGLDHRSSLLLSLFHVCILLHPQCQLGTTGIGYGLRGVFGIWWLDLTTGHALHCPSSFLVCCFIHNVHWSPFTLSFLHFCILLHQQFDHRSSFKVEVLYSASSTISDRYKRYWLWVKGDIWDMIAGLDHRSPFTLSLLCFCILHHPQCQMGTTCIDCLIELLGVWWQDLTIGHLSQFPYSFSYIGPSTLSGGFRYSLLVKEDLTTGHLSECLFVFLVYCCIHNVLWVMVLALGCIGGIWS